MIPASKYSVCLQDEDTETNTGCARTSHDSHEVHDQNASKETGLEAVHGEESPRLQRIAHEECNGKDVDEKTDDNECHEEYNAPAFSKY